VVGKAFADWVYAFADRGKQSAKRRFPVVGSDTVCVFVHVQVLLEAERGR
jgi:hypothetical protein